MPVDKTNEIPVARTMFERLDLVGRLVGLDALHTQMETACRKGSGADYMLTVKGNQKGLRRTLRTRFAAATPAAFSPSTPNANVGLDRRAESRPTGTSTDSHAGGNP